MPTLPLLHGCAAAQAIDSQMSLISRSDQDPTIRGATGAAAVDADAHITIAHPFLGVDRLPVLVPATGSLCHIGVAADHALPSSRIALLEGQSFAVGSIAQQYGIAPFLHRTKNIGTQNRSIIHRDGDVPVHNDGVDDRGSFSLFHWVHCVVLFVFPCRQE